MAFFKAPTFQDRVAAANSARQKALDKLKAKPPVDEAVLAQQRQEREAKEQALNAERTAKREAIAAAKAEAAALREQGFDFYDWGIGEARLVTSWNQDMGAVDRLVEAIARL